MDTVTTYKFKEVEVEDYSCSGPLTEKQKVRQLIAMGYEGIEDPDIEVITEVIK